ncbi:MAG: 50S ribosomal protein L25 [Anaerolineae bacterium]|nr:50S ribosomal protein L25 [Anaerolineae bacterium]
MEQVEILASSRVVIGKQVKALRNQGLVPMVVYGKKTEPMNLKAVEFDAKRALLQASGQLIALKIEGEASPRMVLAREVQRDFISDHLLHIEFFEVDMAEKVRVEVDLNLIGEAQLVKSGQATLLHVLNSVEVECLPGDIMQAIDVDLSKLVDLDDHILVSDLVVPDTIKILTPADELIARQTPIAEEEAEEEEQVAVGVVDAAGQVEVVSRAKEDDGFEE